MQKRKNKGEGNIMKNLSISLKLILGFGSVLVLMIITAGVSINSISRISEQAQMYSKYTVPNSRYMYKMQVDVRTASQYLLNAIIEDDQTDLNAALNKVSEWVDDFITQKEAFEGNQRDHSIDSDIEKLNIAFQEVSEARAKVIDLLLQQTQEGNEEALKIYLHEYKPKVEELISILVKFEDVAKERSDRQSQTVTSLMSSSWNLLISSLVLSIVLTLILIFVIRRSILTPVKEIVAVYDEMAKGNMQVKVNYESRDEMGKMAQSIRKTNHLLTSYINDITEKLKLMSQGDMRINVELDYIGDFSAIKKAMEHTALSLNNTLQTISMAAEQVSVGASQVSSGAQALASGSTEQASSVEELSVTVTKVANQAQTNSENVKTATQYVEEAGKGVEIGNEHMAQLTKAMMDIDSASSQIAHITKTIEDIAFQTNILALNAAIEAARAGSAGKGFAVVADEVRNLAAKSAEAAKKTADLIQNSVATVSKGTQITTQTAQILMDIQEKTQFVVENIIKVDEASAEQAAAIEQIKHALNQVSSVVQTNATTAEENLATSEEISAQATTLHEQVRKFKLNNQNKNHSFVSNFYVKKTVKEEPSFFNATESLDKYDL